MENAKKKVKHFPFLVTRIPVHGARNTKKISNIEQGMLNIEGQAFALALRLSSPFDSAHPSSPLILRLRSG